jgi:hypothetical protein
MQVEGTSNNCLMRCITSRGDIIHNLYVIPMTRPVMSNNGQEELMEVSLLLQLIIHSPLTYYGVHKSRPLHTFTIKKISIFDPPLMHSQSHKSFDYLYTIT